MTPTLSIVAASRNDDHGGNILKRMRLFVNGLITQCNRYNFPVELLIVEWNPVPGKLLLQDILPKPGKTDKLILRYIQVPPEIHNRYRRAQEIPLFQMIAKNVGIRRASGDFILCTNVDLLFSNELFQALTSTKLRSDCFYRANRCDVPDGISEEWDLDQQLTWCSKNVIRRLGRDIRFKNINLEQIGLNHKPAYKKWIFDKLALGMQISWSHERRQYYQIDSFACGDFTLMARQAWLDIQGYFELDLYSIHIDTLGLIAATAIGYNQQIFPWEACTYHIDHTSGWEAMNPLEKIKFLEKRPGVDYGTVFETGLYALKRKQPLLLNAPDWGYANHTFQEFIFPQ